MIQNTPGVGRTIVPNAVTYNNRKGDQADFRLMNFISFEFAGTPPAWYVTAFWELVNGQFRTYHYGPYTTEAAAAAAYDPTQLVPDVFPHPGKYYNAAIRPKLVYIVVG